MAISVIFEQYLIIKAQRSECWQRLLVIALTVNLLSMRLMALYCRSCLFVFPITPMKTIIMVCLSWDSQLRKFSHSKMLYRDVGWCWGDEVRWKARPSRLPLSQRSKQIFSPLSHRFFHLSTLLPSALYCQFITPPRRAPAERPGHPS
jgi:hypothetical protein